VGNLDPSVLAFPFFCFCLVQGEKVASAHDFGWQSKGKDHFKLWFPFFPYLVVTILYLFGYLSGPKTFLCISFVFFRSLIGNFSFFPLFSSDL